MEYKINLAGKKFGKLVVLSFSHTGKRRRKYWLCKCDCGNETTVDGSHLKTGHTTSCGCVVKKVRENIKYVNYKNGLGTSKIHMTYRNMINRCYRKKSDMYYLYGQKGITVCEEWLGKNGFVNFCDWAFANGYSEDLTIDRIDNNKGYSPENCRWVDKYVQANNKRNNRYVKVNGEIGTVAMMSRKYDIKYSNLLDYSKGAKNKKYPQHKIEVVQ